MAGGADYAGKPRPVVIVHDERFSGFPSATFVAFTSDLTDLPLTRLLVQPDSENGLLKSSHLMVDKISTAPKEKLGKKIGILSEDDINRLNRTLLIYLGLAGETR